MPVNVAIMLKEKTKKNNSDEIHDIEKKPIKDNRPAQKAVKESSTVPKASAHKIKVVSRAIATIAAGVMLVVGVSALLQDMGKEEIPTIKDTNLNFETELVPAADYSELYKTIQKVNAQSSKTHFSLRDFFGAITGNNQKDAVMENASPTPAQPKSNDDGASRITSYNVCYTKLLRNYFK